MVNEVSIISDVHLQLRSYKEFEAQRFSLLIDKLIERKSKLYVFSGDLLNHARPTLEELQLLSQELRRLKQSTNSRIIILGGNHEAVTKHTTTYNYIEISSIEYHDNITLDDEQLELRSWTYMKTHKLDYKYDTLITHLRSNMGLIKEEYDIESLSQSFNLVIMGDIHKAYSPFDNVHYTSSPYSTKFMSESTKGYGIGVFNLDTREFSRVELELPCKLKLRCPFIKVDETLKDLDAHIIKLEVVGTLEELKSLVPKPNVIYSKSIDVVQTVNTVGSTKNVNDLLLEVLLEDTNLTKYINFESRIKTKVKELTE